MQILGVDFTSAPTRRKPITCAWGSLNDGVLTINALAPCTSMTEFAQVLATPNWVGGFDMPFGLPRELVQYLRATQGWLKTDVHTDGTAQAEWLSTIRQYAAMSRADIRTVFKGFCDARPVGQKFAHRAVDAHAKSSPSMKWVNPPVDRKSTRLNSSHRNTSRMPSSA